MTILVALGANLPSPHGMPVETLATAIRRLDALRVKVERRSRFYTSPAWPPSAQPDYVNAVVAVQTECSAGELLALLLRIEGEFGRVRSERNAARTLDLDLLAYGDEVLRTADGYLELPHPRLAERPFVLLPLQDVAPGWVHPVTGQTVDAMLARLDLGATRPLGS
jgi:2-amino-4-hydroxy-6-hydroxymethyldihydropteridine diphosphokinase